MRPRLSTDQERQTIMDFAYPLHYTTPQVGHRNFPDPRDAVQYQRTREMTIDELLLENRVVFLVGEITHVSAARVMMQMHYLEDQRRGQDINLYINSPGGSVDDTLAVYDTMQFLSSEVATFCIGRAYSGAAVLLSAGAPGKRHILPHARVMIHQPYGGVSGQTTDILIQAEQILQAKRTLNEIIADHTGQTVERVTKDGERDLYFSAQEAKEYGLVDEVFSPPKKTKADGKEKPASKKDSKDSKDSKGTKGTKGTKDGKDS